MNTVTPKQRRIAIAEFYGYKPVPYVDDCWFVPEGTLCINAKHLPDYPNDLNAMHKAEKKLPDYGAFLKHLSKIVYRDYCADHAHPCGGWTERATAAQRAEAFLLTIGSPT